MWPPYHEKKKKKRHNSVLFDFKKRHMRKYFHNVSGFNEVISCLISKVKGQLVDYCLQLGLK